MADAQAVADLRCVDAAMAACGRGGQPGHALRLLEELGSRGLQPDVMAYTSCIGACAKSGWFESALSLLGEMESKHRLAPSVATFSAAMLARNRTIRDDRLVEVFRAMDRDGTGDVSLKNLEEIMGSRAHAEEVLGELAGNGEFRRSGKLTLAALKEQLAAVYAEPNCELDRLLGFATGYCARARKRDAAPGVVSERAVAKQAAGTRTGVSVKSASIRAVAHSTG